jgi:hypothetical protein
LNAPGGYQAQQGYGRLEVRTSFFPLQWGLFFTTPTIEIDGRAQPGKWGTNFFDLPAGPHALRVYIASYFFMSQVGSAAYQPTVHPGHVTIVAYNAPFFVLLSGGSISEVRGYPMQQLPPGR